MDSALQKYLETIGEVTRLTRKEEVALGKIISGDYSEEEKHEAVNKLVEANLKLVVHYAKKRYKESFITLMDIINAGNLGLFYAAQKYDPVKFGQASFGTYARRSIQKYINKLLYEQFITTPPALIYNQYQISQLKLQYGDDITDEFIKSKLKFKDSEYNNIKKSYITKQSLDAPINEEKDEGSVFEILPDETASSKFREIEIKDEFSYVLQVMDLCLTDIEKDIIHSMILSEEPQTLNELGARYNYTGENIRMKKTKALNKLREKMLEKDAVFA